ncbi:MAG TPA: choice-of-anchor tandem repeat GloVer-containing protein, partial [Candidatus Acidoferrum sp.]|nr:choice-of-anchor tandem repeat GloVer-containing protein [Candidatus Acidoferrum sp.]
MTAQTFTNLYGFTGGSDGGAPYAGLTLSGNTLYGTTTAAGSSSNGTVFAVNTDGSGFTNLHGFTGGNDGGAPYAGLILSGNTLYGTTTAGGSSGNGTVFAVNTDGSGFTNLYRFTGGNDGSAPFAGLILSSNTLYGTASVGGSSGNGTVFAVNTDGSGFTNLYGFTGGNDGSAPSASLIISGNTLY